MKADCKSVGALVFEIVKKTVRVVILSLLFSVPFTLIRWCSKSINGSSAFPLKEFLGGAAGIFVFLFIFRVIIPLIKSIKIAKKIDRDGIDWHTARCFAKEVYTSDGLPQPGSIIEFVFVSNNLRIRYANGKPHPNIYFVIASDGASITYKDLDGHQHTLKEEDYFDFLLDPSNKVLVYDDSITKSAMHLFFVEYDEPTLFGFPDHKSSMMDYNYGQQTFPPVGSVIEITVAGQSMPTCFLVVSIDGEEMTVEDENENERVISLDKWNEFKEKHPVKIKSQEDIQRESLDMLSCLKDHAN